VPGLNLPLAFAVGGVAAAALYAGVKDPAGGIAAVFQGVIKGSLPAGQTATSGAELASYALTVGGTAPSTTTQSTSQLTSSGGAGGGGTGAPGMVTQAARWLGTPYSWGGGGVNGPSRGILQGAGTVGFDCSGLTQYAAYHALGITLGRTTAQQCQQGTAVSLTMSAWAVGDLVFTDANGHVGIYAGNGQVINAPHTGAVVRYESCTNSYWIPSAVRRLAATATA
jgi:cell wall-associated NlpC family hydrolase